MISCFQLAADRRAARGANETSTKTLGRIQGACGAERCFGESLKRWFHSFVNLASQQSCHLHPQEKSNQIWLKAWQYATWVLKQICPENLGFKVTNANTVHKLVEVRLRGGTRCNLIYQLMEHFKTRMHPEKPFYNYSQRTAASYPIILEGLFSIQRGNEKVYISDWKKSTVHLKKNIYPSKNHSESTLFQFEPGHKVKDRRSQRKDRLRAGRQKGAAFGGEGMVLVLRTEHRCFSQWKTRQFSTRGSPRGGLICHVVRQRRTGGRTVWIPHRRSFPARNTSLPMRKIRYGNF